MISLSYLCTIIMQLYLAEFRLWPSVGAAVRCSSPPSLSSLHCPDSPFFSHTTLFSTWMPTSHHICRCLRYSVTNLNAFCGSVWIRIHGVIWLSSRVNVYIFSFVTKLSIFSLKPRTIRKLTRNGVCVGPENMINLNMRLIWTSLANRSRIGLLFGQSSCLNYW